MTIDIAHLRELLEKATPRPWRAAYNRVESVPRVEAVDAAATASDDALDAMPESIVAYVDTSHGDTASSMGIADAALIVALVNAAPALLEITALAVAYEGSDKSGTSTDAYTARMRLFDKLREIGITDDQRIAAAVDRSRTP